MPRFFQSSRDLEHFRFIEVVVPPLILPRVELIALHTTHSRDASTKRPSYFSSPHAFNSKSSERLRTEKADGRCPGPAWAGCCGSALTGDREGLWEYTGAMTPAEPPDPKELQDTIDRSIELLESWSSQSQAQEEANLEAPPSSADSQATLVRKLLFRALWHQVAARDEALLQLLQMIGPLEKTAVKVQSLAQNIRVHDHPFLGSQQPYVDGSGDGLLDDVKALQGATQRISNRLGVLRKNSEWKVFAKDIRERLALLDTDLNAIMNLFTFSKVTRPRERTRLAKFVRDHRHRELE